MKKTEVILLVSGLLLSLISCSKKPGIPLQEHPDVNEWNALFAEDLSDALYPDGIWTYTNNILTATEDEMIWTNISYDNFILDLEFRNDTGTNSGVIVYCSHIDDWIPNSVEIQIADDFVKEEPGVPDIYSCGAVFGHLAPSKSMVRPPGEWNRITITCYDRMIYVILNGEPVIEMDMSQWTSAKRNPDGTEIPSWLNKPLASLPTSGHIGFQGKHGDAAIFFRNIRIRELD